MNRKVPAGQYQNSPQRYPSELPLSADGHPITFTAHPGAGAGVGGAEQNAKYTRRSMAPGYEQRNELNRNAFLVANTNQQQPFSTGASGQFDGPQVPYGVNQENIRQQVLRPRYFRVLHLF